MELLQGIWNAILDFTKLLVIPDWGALIALLPVFMGLVVIVFFAYTVVSYRRLGSSVLQQAGKREISSWFAGAAALLDAHAHADDRTAGIGHHGFDAVCGSGIRKPHHLVSQPGCGHHVFRASFEL